uniref:Fatty-acid amide hydrolase 1 n=1 Tax=Leptobrachium leishanense TaxID=445787 RepID=A0A8C5Q9E9_9ANUR
MSWTTDLGTMHERWQEMLPEYGLNMAWKVAASLGCLLAATVFVLKWKKKRLFLKRVEQEQKRREETVKAMQEKVNGFKKKNPGVDQKRILNLSLTELLELLRDGSLSPEGVLYAYVEKALEVNENTNCVTVFLTDCEDQLQELKKQETHGPLYGIPISVKEHIGYKRQPSTCGLVQYLDDLENDDSVAVKVLKKQGAIVFAKTNVPQSLFCYETSNPIYGLTLNPQNQAKCSGGSSGGEGALIGGGGSILGLGSDTGGSIRIPASFCGVAGLKPSTNRISMKEVREIIDGLTIPSTVIGPLARDVDSLALCMKALLCDEMFKLDPTVPPLPFNDQVYSSSKPLRVGYYETDGFNLPSPGMRRAVLETTKLLEEAGHTVVHFTPPRIDYMKEELFMRNLVADGGATLYDKLNKNIIDPNLQEVYLMSCLPAVVRKALSFFLKPWFPRMARSLTCSLGISSMKDHWRSQTAVQEYQAEFIAEWKTLELDVLLCPMTGPAYNIGYAGKLLGRPGWRRAPVGRSMCSSPIPGRIMSALHEGGGDPHQGTKKQNIKVLSYFRADSLILFQPLQSIVDYLSPSGSVYTQA